MTNKSLHFGFLVLYLIGIKPNLSIEKIKDAVLRCSELVKVSLSKYKIVLTFILAGIFTSCQAQQPTSSSKKSNPMDTTKKYNALTPEQERVIEHKGTDRPFTGEYYQKTDKGIYICRRCNNPLYTSDDKFDGHCGWPSFDMEIKGSVTRVSDADGRRVEIICNNCNGHLGHVFEGEGFTNKDTRHCVNTSSILFVPADKIKTLPSVID